MSFPWMLVRGASSNPSSLKFAALMNKQSIAENELFKPDKQQPGIISAHIEDLILLQDPFFFKKLATKTNKYFGPWEPDGVLLKYWCRFNHLTRKMHDHSFSKNYTYPHGSPKLCEGPDDGVKGGRIITKLNSNNDVDNPDYFSTPDHSSIRVSTATNGFSIYLEFIVDDMGSVEGEFDPTLQYKFDDSNNRRCIRFSPDLGRLHFHVREGGVNTNFYTPTNTIYKGGHYKCWFRYNPTTDIARVTVNNIAMTDVADGDPSTGNATTDLLHGKRGSEDGGYPFVRFIDSRWYNFEVLDDHIQNMWNNGRSICARNVLLFDGVNDDCNLGNDATLWSLGLTKFAFSFWIYPTIMQDGINRLLARHGNTGYGFECNIDSTVAGQVNWQLRNSDNSVVHEANCGTQNLCKLNKWNQVIGSYENGLGSANGKIFVNGIQGTQTFNFTDTINSSNIFELGGPSNDLAGYMADFRWWKNDSFNATEAEDFFTQGIMPSTPDYWLKMNEGVGTTAALKDWITRTKAADTDATWVIGPAIFPTELGSLAVAGYSRFNGVMETIGYDSTGYDSTGFDTT